MGYGVVKPTLGRTMIWVRWLAAAHLLFGLIYSIGGLIILPEKAGEFLPGIHYPLLAADGSQVPWHFSWRYPYASL